MAAATLVVTTIRDLERGKWVVVAEEIPREAPVEWLEFTPAAGSSGHDPILKSDFAEFVCNDVLAQLLAEDLTVVAAVLAAFEERLRQIGLAEKEERLRQEAEELARETETAERAQEEAAWAQESTVELARTRL